MENKDEYNKISEKQNKSLFSSPPFYITPRSDIGDFSRCIDSATSALESDDFFKSLKPFLVFGKVIGVLPFSGVFGSSSSRELSYRKRSFTAFVTYIIFGCVVFNGILGIISSVQATRRNALEIAESVRSALYFVWGTLIFITFIIRGDQFLELFTAWNSTEIAFSKKDKTLRKDTLIIIGLIFTSAILENLVLHCEYIQSWDSISGHKYGNHTKDMSTLEAYYWRANPHWAKLIGYNWFLAVLAFITHKWILYAWNYIDVCIAIFARAIYYRFNILCELAEDRLLGKREVTSLNYEKSKICRDHRSWHQVVYDHENLCRLLEILENFFSPLIFASFSVNMFYISLQLLDGLTSEQSKYSIIHSIYAPWSFLHLVMRLFIVSICCARINVYAHKIRSIFQECPVEYYSTEISRIDKRVTAGPDIGLTGLGSFVVTKSFILSTLGVVFSVEVILLQCVPTQPVLPPGCTCEK